jgi:hypothetical protein
LIDTNHENVKNSDGCGRRDLSLVKCSRSQHNSKSWFIQRNDYLPNDSEPLGSRISDGDCGDVVFLESVLVVQEEHRRKIEPYRPTIEQAMPTESDPALGTSIFTG